VSGPVSSTLMSGQGEIPGVEVVVSETAGIEPRGDAPAGSLELGCTWPLQARIWDLRSRPLLLRVWRKSAIFLADEPGSFI
jgi:hypothetical protein